MKFTSYYSQMVKAHGVPHIGSKEHFLIMNILFLEASMHALENLPCEGQSQVNKNKKMEQLKWKLRDLTRRQTPEELFRMVME